jgi:pyruvate dehydrogenase E1 component alpha subunit
VYKVTREAVEKARDPDEGQLRPTLIEAVQYRFGAHTTADDPTVYRSEAEVEEWKRRDPIPRLETFLRETGRLDDERVAAIEASVEDRVADAIDAAESVARPDPEEMFANVYDTPPTHLREQAREFGALRDRLGDDAFLRQ